MFSQFKTLIQLLDYFREEETCIAYWENARWRGNVTCPHCKAENPYKTNRGYKCTNICCQKKFSAFTGSMFENTKLSLRTWFGAIYLITAHKKGVSSLQISRDLGICQKSAWFLLHRIRQAMGDMSPVVLDGIVEVDESFVGGKNKNRHRDKKIAGSQGRSRKDKTPVIGLVERGGRVVTFVTRDTDHATLHNIIDNNVSDGATIVTDAYNSYNGLEERYKHVVIKHEAGSFYVKKEGDNTYHTQHIEGYWACIKRGYVGVYHYMSPKHLQRYCDEYAYRYNTRKMTDTDRFEHLLSTQCAIRNLPYNTLIGKS